MERRKLLFEKLVDGELRILVDAAGNVPKLLKKHNPMAAFKSGVPVFVFDLADVEVAINAIPDDTWSHMMLNLPYPRLLVELRGGGTDVAAYITADPAVIVVFARDGDTALLLGVAEGERETFYKTCMITLGSDVSMVDPSKNQFDVVRSANSWVLSALSLLNVQGDVVRERLEAPAEVNAKRAKRGKPQLQPYTYVHLNRETDHSTSGESTGRVVSQHIRRGHFKRTRHGTFWWRPCVVGSGPAKERKAYIVKS